MMIFTKEQIDNLRHEVGKRLSKKRFQHTLGVEKMAVHIGKTIMPDRVNELRAAALLHDVSKEYSEAEYLDLIQKHNISFGDEDKRTPALWHSITAPTVVASDFPEFASDDVLSAVYNHTVGSPDMSVFDEIILLSDYIEDGRSYQNCVDLRQSFLSELNMADTPDMAIASLHKAVAKSLDNNINELVSRDKEYHTRTRLTRDAILKKIERQNNG